MNETMKGEDEQIKKKRNIVSNLPSVEIISSVCTLKGPKQHVKRLLNSLNGACHCLQWHASGPSSRAPPTRVRPALITYAHACNGGVDTLGALGLHRGRTHGGCDMLDGLNTS